ncbi:MAG: glycosyltransferase [Synergistaceae bacterium]|jgi:glycosyltransferase involved in cell wall biosynthesis|nr:glycosyltransferase [Synergistaceae bacterium]
MLPMISVVIPAYNAQNTIEPTLRSVFAQEYRNLEVIVADDASKDGTAAAARRALLAGDRPWKLIELESNRGVSAARNEGMKAASGEYLLFMDADDRADPDFLTILHGVISVSGADIAFCGFRSRDMRTGKEDRFPVKLDPSRGYTAEDLAVMRIFKKIDPTVWTMLFRKDFIFSRGLSFAEGCSHGQDVEFVIEALSVAGHAAFSPECPFVYMHHANMASAADRSFGEKKLRRYADFTESHFRMARFLTERSGSKKLAEIANRFLLPTAYIKRLTLCAWQKDRRAFDEILASREVRDILRSSRRYAAKKPEVFLKSLCLLTAPGLYYRMRAR